MPCARWHRCTAPAQHNSKCLVRGGGSVCRTNRRPPAVHQSQNRKRHVMHAAAPACRSRTCRSASPLNQTQRASNARSHANRANETKKNRRETRRNMIKNQTKVRRPYGLQEPTEPEVAQTGASSNAGNETTSQTEPEPNAPEGMSAVFACRNRPARRVFRSGVRLYRNR